MRRAPVASMPMLSLLAIVALGSPPVVTASAPGFAAGSPATARGPARALSSRQDTTAAPDSLLEATLRANRYRLELTPDGELRGPGADFLLEEGRAAQFFLMGEEHGVAEIPEISAALFRDLAPAGYRHLAIEIGPSLADTLEGLVRGPDPEEALTAFYRDHPPGALFFSLRPDADMLIEAVRSARGTRDVLWGLDYDILGDRYALRRLAALAPDSAAQAAADRALAVADSFFRAAREAGDLSRVFMFRGPDSVLERVREAYDPAPGSETDRILEELQETLTINHLFMDGKNYESNQRRAALLKRNFHEAYRWAVRAGEDRPRVFFRFGGYHMMRGRNFNDAFDLGTAASALAVSNESRSFGVMAIGGPGTRHAVVDGETFGWKAAELDVARAPWARPLVRAAGGDGFQVLDLRPLRPLEHAGKLGDLSPRLARLIYAFDAVVVLNGSTPSEPLPGSPWMP